MSEQSDIWIQKLNQIHAKVNAIGAGLSEEPLKDTHFEKEYYSAFPTCDGDDPKFGEKFLSLVRGLDEESVSSVVLSLKRLKVMKESDERILPLYTPGEQREIKERLFEFDREIIRVSENCFYYRGYMLPKPRFEPDVFIGRVGIDELEHKERFADSDIIDAGAYIGDSALILSKMTTGRVHAFEPTNSNYRDMLKTIELNGCDNIVPRKAALGDIKGSVEMTNAFVSSANAYVEKSTMPYMGTETVDVITLDEYVRENDVNVGLIKIDVEGAEQMVLGGAMETIKQQKPSLLVSIYHNASDFFGIKPLLESLDIGYTFKIRHTAIDTVLMETMLIAEAAE